MSRLSEMDVDIIGEMASKLDLQHKGKNNWKELAAELGVPRREFLVFGSDPDNKPTKELFEYLITRYPDLTMKDLKHKLRELTRTDVVEVIEQSSSGCYITYTVLCLAPSSPSPPTFPCTSLPFFFILPSSSSFSSFHCY